MAPAAMQHPMIYRRSVGYTLSWAAPGLACMDTLVRYTSQVIVALKVIQQSVAACARLESAAPADEGPKIIELIRRFKMLKSPENCFDIDIFINPEYNI